MRLYECGVRYEKVGDNGMKHMVTELYLVDALSFAEAEARVAGQLHNEVDDSFDVATIKRTNYSNAVRSLSDDADTWFKVKVNLITVDVKTGKEKRQPIYYIMEASDIDNARKAVVKYMEGSMADYEIATLDATKIVDFFTYNTSTANG